MPIQIGQALKRKRTAENSRSEGPTSTKIQFNREQEFEDGQESDDDADSLEEDERRKSRNGKQREKGNRVLPVAELDDDWQGEIEDGATYLALAK